jgi:hypothetical protein
VAERDLPYRVPALEYVDVESRALDRMRVNWDDWWGDQTPIALCSRCGLHYTEDVNKDAFGKPMHQDPEDDHENVCEDCLRKGLGEALEADLLHILGDKPRLAERYRAVLKSAIETNRHDTLLESAGRLRADGQHEAAIAMAQAACEVCTKTTLQALFLVNDIAYLTDPVGNLLPSYNLGNDRVRKLYVAVSGDPIQNEAFWSTFKQHAKRRHEVLHEGREPEPWESEASIEAVRSVVSHLLKS